MSNLNLIQSKNGDYQQKRKNWKKNIYIFYYYTFRVLNRGEWAE